VKPAPDAPVTAPERKETSRVWVYYKARCGQCEYIADRRQLESESWGDLTSHMRANHGGNVTEVKILRTIIEELAEEQE